MDVNVPYSEQTFVHHAYEILCMYDGPDYMVRLCVAPGNDPRHYNLPTANEVGVFRGIIVILSYIFVHNTTMILMIVVILYN